MISAGTLNRVRASVKYTDHSELNVSASYLAKEGVEITFQGNIVESLQAMTGVVQSPQPYLLSQVKIHLLRSQALATLYKKQWEKNGLVGGIRLYTDSNTFGEFDLSNVAITSVGDMTFAGGEPGVVITLTGTYYVNSDMWEL
ncbi:MULTISPECIES: hypothetical protein [Serratia]|uniref:Uncharacterized protein n=1 Tax=Serratia proteamaculans TaxID=28151 RepID=A0ABS0U149_SERPR|nr:MULTISPECIES: hypothetical protein [Serratia]MBI6183433.1 hypothetical protein [Serratia proteamaculans]HEJ7884096.1 hypothetical protein [Serratia liquefaciens]